MGSSAECFGIGLVRTHIEVIAGLGCETYEGVVRVVDNGPTGGFRSAMSHDSHLPGGLVGKLGHILLPNSGDGRMGNLRGGDVHNGGHSVVSSEVYALPGRETLVTTVVLHVEVVVGGGADVEGHRKGSESTASLGQSVQDVTLGLHVVLCGTEDIVEVVGLSLLGLRPGGHDGGLAGLLNSEVSHYATGAESTESGTLPCAAHVVGSTTVSAHIYIVFGIGGEAAKGAGQSWAFIGIRACIGIEGGSIKLDIALDDLIAAHIVASRSPPCNDGTSLGNIIHLYSSHCRASLDIGTMMEGCFRQEVRVVRCCRICASDTVSTIETITTIIKPVARGSSAT